MFSDKTFKICQLGSQCQPETSAAVCIGGQAGVGKSKL